MKKSLLALALSLCLSQAASAYVFTLGPTPITVNSDGSYAAAGAFDTYTPTTPGDPGFNDGTDDAFYINQALSQGALTYTATVDSNLSTGAFTIFYGGSQVSTGTLSFNNGTSQVPGSLLIDASMNQTSPNGNISILAYPGGPTYTFAPPTDAAGTFVYDPSGNQVGTFTGTVSNVPEPSTWGMLSLGALGAGVMAVRRRQRMA